MSKLRDKIQIQDQDSEEVEIDLLELFQYFRSTSHNIDHCIVSRWCCLYDHAS